MQFLRPVARRPTMIGVMLNRLAHRRCATSSIPVPAAGGEAVDFATWWPYGDSDHRRSSTIWPLDSLRIVRNRPDDQEAAPLHAVRVGRACRAPTLAVDTGFHGGEPSCPMGRRDALLRFATSPAGARLREAVRSSRSSGQSRRRRGRARPTKRRRSQSSGSTPTAAAPRSCDRRLPRHRETASHCRHPLLALGRRRRSSRPGWLSAGDDSTLECSSARGDRPRVPAGRANSSSRRRGLLAHSGLRRAGRSAIDAEVSSHAAATAHGRHSTAPATTASRSFAAPPTRAALSVTFAERRTAPPPFRRCRRRFREEILAGDCDRARGSTSSAARPASSAQPDTVDDGLRRLEDEGLVVIARRRGTLVAPVDERDVAKSSRSAPRSRHSPRSAPPSDRPDANRGDERPEEILDALPRPSPRAMSRHMIAGERAFHDSSFGWRDNGAWSPCTGASTPRSRIARSTHRALLDGSSRPRAEGAPAILEAVERATATGRGAVRDHIVRAARSFTADGLRQGRRPCDR